MTFTLYINSQLSSSTINPPNLPTSLNDWFFLKTKTSTLNESRPNFYVRKTWANRVFIWWLLLTNKKCHQFQQLKYCGWELPKLTFLILWGSVLGNRGYFISLFKRTNHRTSLAMKGIALVLKLYCGKFCWLATKPFPTASSYCTWRIEPRMARNFSSFFCM